MRILGLDAGEKRIGVALSDPDGILASPLTVIEGKSDDEAVREIIRIAADNEAGLILIGIPRSLSGEIGKQAQRVLDFAALLSRSSPIPLDTWDERFSTVAAERMLSEAGTKKHKRKLHRDAVAAAIVLQSYLDRQKSPARDEAEDDGY